MIDLLDTIPQLLAARVKLSGPKTAFYELDSEGLWQPVTWSDFGARVASVASLLSRRGIRPGDKVGILLPNSLNWEILHHAILRIGGVIVALERLDPPERLEEIITNAEPIALFVESSEKIQFLSIPGLKIAVSFSENDPDWESWDSFNSQPASGGHLPPLPVADQPCALIYTSGTTGKAKGIEYSHGQMILAVKAIIRNYGEMREGCRFICWLPLSALFQRMSDLYAIVIGAETYFLSDPKQIMNIIREVSPDFFIGVPRFYEKLWAGIDDNIRHKPWPLKKFIQFAIGIGGVRARRIREKRNVGPLVLLLSPVLDKVVLSKIRGVMGKNLKFMVSGSAAIPTHLLEYFHAIGLLVLEAYGLSENIVPMAMNSPESFSFGSVGKLLPEQNIRFDAESGILVKGPGLFKGYYRDTAPVVNAEGFYDTGDFGELRAEFLTLKGRRAELIKTSTGRRIAPVTVEGALKASSYIEQVAVFGSGHKRLIALITLNEQVLAKQQIPMFSLYDQLPAEFEKALKESLHTAAQALSSQDRPAGYIVLQSNFSIIEGEITTNQKLRRKNIQERYRLWMDRMFSIIDQQEKESAALLMFVSEAQIRQARFEHVATQEKVASSRLRRAFLISRMLLRVAEIKFIDSLPHLDLGHAWFMRRRMRALRKMGTIITHELSDLKGPAAKLGQMASYLTDVVPFPIRDSLRKLQSAATPLSKERIIEIVERSLGRPIDSVFSHWDDLPLAVASMSQVHRAKLLSGETVAVKVIYPEARKFTTADIEILKIMFPMIARGMGFSNGPELMQEFLLLFQQETDLMTEAVNQEIFRKIFADDPRVVIPQVYLSYSSRDVLTMEYVAGVSYEQFKLAASQQAKNWAGEIIFSVTSQALSQYGIFNADPHPGNYLFLEGKVCFLDFGFVKRWPVPFIDLWKQQSLRGASRDMPGFIEATEKLGFKGVKDYGELVNQFHAISYTPWREDRLYKFTREFMSREIGKIFYYPNNVGPIRMPPQFAAMSRLFGGMYSVLADLEAEANWHKILVPYMKAPTRFLAEIEKNITIR